MTERGIRVHQVKSREKSECCFIKFTCGFLLLYSSQRRLCSRTKRVCIEISPGCSLALESPAASKRLVSRPTGLSFDKASVFSCEKKKKSESQLFSILFPLINWGFFMLHLKIRAKLNPYVTDILKNLNFRL